MVPPVRAAKKRFQIVSCSPHDHKRWRYKRSYYQEHAENGDDYSKSLQKVQICDFHRFG
jgi:hypothetical protein